MRKKTDLFFTLFYKDFFFCETIKKYFFTRFQCIKLRKFLRSHSGKYPWERYEPPYPPSYVLNSTTTVLLGELLWR